MTRRNYRAVPRPHPLLRVVRDDRPEMLALQPELERRWRRRAWTQRAGVLAGVACVLGLGAALAAVAIQIGAAVMRLMR